MAIKIPRPRWPGEPPPGEPRKPWPTIGAPRAVRPEIYGVMPVAQVESELRRDKMPAPFIRRMRVINILSALTLRKIEDDMIAPFEVMDIHHVLDEQISQDAIIAMLDNKNLALALETGNMQPLWVESKEKPLLRKGFEQQWIQRFVSTPFDPICVMLAMRAKLMLDVVDELGHSYDLLRALGMGWIDFGEIPGEEPGDPDDYVPPVIDTPIDDPDIPPEPPPDEPEIPPEPGDPDYIPPGDEVPGDPDYVPTPGDQDYVPPGDRVPGDPGYDGVPGEPPGYPEGWDEGIVPGHPDYEPGPGEPGYRYPSSPGGGHYGGDYGPGGEGAPGGPSGGGGDYASAVPPAPLGYGPGAMFSGRGFGVYSWGVGINCCLDKDDPESLVHIGYFTDSIKAGETLGLTVEGEQELCGGENFEWIEVNGVGSLSAESGLDVIYTAPATGANCPGNAEIWLMCGGEIIASLIVTIDYEYVISFIYPDPETEIARNDSVVVNVEANGTPLTWAVSGTGFSLEHDETAGTGNVLHADETACGAAMITVTDCDGNQAIGSVRCTTGQWVVKSSDCQMAGEVGVITYSGASVYATCVKGYQWQYSRYKAVGRTARDYESCEAAIAKISADCDCLIFTLPCPALFSNFYPVPVGCLACRKDDCVGTDPYTISYNDYELQGHTYKEWEC